jgi:hypothetical protein
MTIELLIWEGCPSHPKALSDLREAIKGLGLDDTSEITIQKIESQAEAEAERFIGSPTIRIDGHDVNPVEGEPYSLSCRVYHRRDGRISATPDPADVREALLAAQAKDSENVDPAPQAGSQKR